MITCAELKKLKNTWRGETCILGTPPIGEGTLYELISAIGFSVDFYCNSLTSSAAYVENNFVVRDIQYLYAHKDNVLVFLDVPAKDQQLILKQLANHSVDHIVPLEISGYYIAQIMEEVDKSDNAVKEKWYALYDDKEFLLRTFKRKMGYKLDLENPKTFCEKLQWLKLHDRKSSYTQMVDKYAMKKYIATKIGNEYIVPTLGIYDSFEDIPFEMLPNQFVLKCTHDSGSTVICRDKSNFNIEKAKEILERRLKINYYWFGREWAYKNITPRIIAEKLLAETSEDALTDYKFFCFSGTAKVMYIGKDASKNPTSDFYDMDFNHLPIKIKDPNSDRPNSKPPQFEKMRAISERLSDGIPHLRVDFYIVNGQIYVGELTFFHMSGFSKITPLTWEKRMGDWIDIDNLENYQKIKPK